jgi:glycosyltransferase involved in cell wall biosynthesis
MSVSTPESQTAVKMHQPVEPLVNIAVSGDFKQLQLVPELNKIARLGRVIYASRLSNDAERLQISRAQARNLFPKEYLLQFHSRYLGHVFADTIYPLYDMIWQASAQLAWQRCDVMHVVLQGKALSLMKRAKREGSAILGHPVNCHPDFFEREVRREVERFAMDPAPFLPGLAETREEIALCDRIFCLSTLVRDSFVSAGFPADRIDVIPMPIDMQTYVPGKNQATARPFRVVCVAELNPRKGHIYLLEAWKALRLPNAELVLVGTMRQEMKAILKNYEGLFRYAGALGRDDLVRLYQDSSLLVLPSVEDGFGLVVAEAIACGVPAIVTENVGARSLIRPGENGYVVPPRSPEALAKAIAAVHASPALQMSLREGAIASRASFPNLTETAGLLARAYRRTWQDSKAAQSAHG